MPEHETLRGLLKLANLSEIARGAGVPYHKLYRFAHGGARPSHELIAKVEAHLSKAFAAWIAASRG